MGDLLQLEQRTTLTSYERNYAECSNRIGCVAGGVADGSAPNAAIVLRGRKRVKPPGAKF